MRIKITKHAYLKMTYYIKACPIEVQGFGKVREKMEGKEKIYEIYDVEILDQVATGSHTTISEEVMAKFMFEKTKAGESTKAYRVWWHSHVEMAAFFSGTDTGTIEDFTEWPWLISVVGNKRSEFLVRYDSYEPKRVTVEHLRLEVAGWDDPELLAQCRKEIASKVKQQVWAPWKYQGDDSYHGMSKKQRKRWRREHPGEQPPAQPFKRPHSEYTSEQPAFGLKSPKFLDKYFRFQQYENEQQNLDNTPDRELTDEELERKYGRRY